MTTATKKRYCAYCRGFIENVGFKVIRHRASNSSRAQCPACQEVRKLPQEELDRRAKQDAADRSRAASEFSKQIAEERKQKTPWQKP